MNIWDDTELDRVHSLGKRKVISQSPDELLQSNIDSKTEFAFKGNKVGLVGDRLFINKIEYKSQNTGPKVVIHVIKSQQESEPSVLSRFPVFQYSGTYLKSQKVPVPSIYPNIF